MGFGKPVVEKIEKVEDTNPNLYLERAESCLRRGEIYQALHESDKAIRFSNGQAHYIWEKARILYGLGNYEAFINLVVPNLQRFKQAFGPERFNLIAGDLANAYWHSRKPIKALLTRLTHHGLTRGVTAVSLTVLFLTLVYSVNTGHGLDKFFNTRSGYQDGFSDTTYNQMLYELGQSDPAGMSDSSTPNSVTSDTSASESNTPLDEDLDQLLEAAPNPDLVDTHIRDIKFSLPTDVIEVGEKVKAVFTIDSGGYELPSTFLSSSDSSVATFGGNDIVTGIAPGVATIYVEVGGRKAGAEVRVVNQLGLEITADKNKLAVGEKVNTQTVVSSDPVLETTPQLTYSSSNSSIAAVDAEGIIHAVLPGEATITAQIGQKSSSTTIVVAEESWGEYIACTESAQNGSLYLANLPGPDQTGGCPVELQQTINLNAATQPAGYCPLPGHQLQPKEQGESLDPSVHRIKLEFNNLVIMVGDKYPVNYTVSPAVPENTVLKINYHSSNEAILSVTDKGEMVGLSPGQVTITVSSGNVSSSMSVIVIEKQ